MRWSLILNLLLVGTAVAETQPYAGQQAREIASLSESDVKALLAGDGWGLAKPAELNGYPGPAHLLELADELSLSDEQLASVQTTFDRMNAEARRIGEDYVDAEAHLSTIFRRGHADRALLEELLEESAQLLAELRAVHLAAHLEVTPLLSKTQRDAYARLRGYDADQGPADHGTGHGNH